MGRMEGQHGKLIMRKVVGKAFTAGGRFDLFLDSGNDFLASACHSYQ